MDKEKAKLWIAALRSGDYMQGKNALWLEEVDSYCCLGVLADIAVQQGCGEREGGFFFNRDELDFRRGGSYTLPRHIATWVELDIDATPDPDVLDFSHIPAAVEWWQERINPDIFDCYSRSLASLNDSGVATFADIADFIEKFYAEL